MDGLGETHMLVARQSGYCQDRYGRVYRCSSSWSNWGRWVALAVIVVAAFIIFFLVACISARRRRKAGRKPFYGTGWVGNTAPGRWGQGQPQYNPNYQTQQPQYGYQGGQQYNNNASAPPNYGQSTGGYYGGQQQTGGEAQSYFGGQRGGDAEAGFAPPAGPPPGKGGVVR